MCNGHVRGLYQFRIRRIVISLLSEVLHCALESPVVFLNIHRDMGRRLLSIERTHDRLTYPPGGHGAEFQATLWFELVHRADEPDLPFLRDVLVLQTNFRTNACVAARNAVDQSSIGLDKAGACCLTDSAALAYLVRQCLFLLTTEQRWFFWSIKIQE